MNRPLSNMPNGECFRLEALRKGARCGNPLEITHRPTFEDKRLVFWAVGIVVFGAALIGRLAG